MQLEEKALLLRIFIGENDRFDQHPLYEAIVLKARERGLAGATYLRGPMGFGHSSRLHTAKILRLSEDLPIVVEIIDSEQNITAFLPLLDRWSRVGSFLSRRYEFCAMARIENSSEHRRGGRFDKRMAQLMLVSGRVRTR